MSDPTREKRPQRRPPESYIRTLTRELPTIRCTPEDLDALHRVAAHRGVRVAEAVRQLIREAAKDL